MSEGRVRCLLIAGTFPPVIGGSSAVYDNLARQSGGRIAILTSYLDHRTGLEHAGWREADAQRPYPVDRIALVRPPLAEAAARAGWGPLGYLRLSLALMNAARKLVRAHDIGVVCIADDETVGWLVPFVKFALGCRALIYCHGDDLVHPRERFWRRLWFSLTDAVVAASRFAAERLVRDFGVNASKVALIVNGVDGQHFRPLNRSAILDERYGSQDRRVILTASRLVARKGIDRTLDAVALLLPRHPDLLYLVVGDGEQQQELKIACARLGIEHAVKFAGAVPYEDMPAHYGLADIVVLPNRAAPGDEDGLPLVFLEANACAKPVIGGRAGGTPEAVNDGVNGLLVDGNDPAAIAEAIDRVLSDSELRMRLVAGARQVAKEADWRERAIAFRELCDSVARHSRKSGQ